MRNVKYRSNKLSVHALSTQCVCSFDLSDLIQDDSMEFDEYALNITHSPALLAMYTTPACSMHACNICNICNICTPLLDVHIDLNIHSIGGNLGKI